MAISLEAYEIPKEGTLKKDLKWVPQYETLENGSHRLMDGIMDLRGPEDYDTYTLGVEFVIGR
jgi:hypothetical protein